MTYMREDGAEERLQQLSSRCLRSRLCHYLVRRHHFRRTHHDIVGGDKISESFVKLVTKHNGYKP